MLDFVRRSYRAVLEVTLYLCPVVYAIIGAVIGGGAGAGYGFLGFIGGACAGLMISVLFGGLQATFIEMGNDVKAIRNDLYQIQKRMDSMATPQVKPSVPSSKIAIDKHVDVNQSTVDNAPTADPDAILDLESVDSAITEFDVILKSAGAEKMAVVGVMQNVLGIGLMEAKSIASYAPKLLKGACSKDEARSIKNAVENAGGQVTIKAAKK